MRHSTKRHICGACGKVLDHGQFCNALCVGQAQHKATRAQGEWINLTDMPHGCWVMVTKENLMQRLQRRALDSKLESLRLALKAFPYEDLRPLLPKLNADQWDALEDIWPELAPQRPESAKHPPKVETMESKFSPGSFIVSDIELTGTKVFSMCSSMYSSLA